MVDLTGRVVVVSPHLDDAVLSCGELMRGLPDCVVLTVFAGSPTSWEGHSVWDHDFCGFAEGTDVVAARLREDDEALASLGVSAARLDLLDEQYRQPGSDPSPEEIGGLVIGCIDRVGAEVAIIPLGLGHVDHRLTSAGCRSAALDRPDLRWLAYQDLPYGYEEDLFGPGLVEDALALLFPLPARLVELEDPSAGAGTAAKAAKDAALDHYPSQMRGLGARRLTALQPERYWELLLPDVSGW
jgi:LmbE family N-acetylglucosaminyl deacetylase